MKNHSALVTLIRPLQWIKNGFVMAPVVFSGNLFVAEKFQDAVAATVLFCLLASAIYVLNDIKDAAADREHHKKRLRPIASGAVSVSTAWGLFGVLVVLVIAGAVLLFESAYALWSVLALYTVINVSYSLGLKHVQLVEMFLVASGFILRLLAGGFATGIAMTNWILITTGLVALMLVAGKRRGDLAQGNDPDTQRRAMLGYDIRYLDALMVMLSAATLVSYVMFCTSEYGAARFGEWVVLTSVFVAFGVFRFLQIVIVQDGGDSPTHLVVRDPMMASAVLGWIGLFVILIYGDKLIGVT